MVVAARASRTGHAHRRSFPPAPPAAAAFAFFTFPLPVTVLLVTVAAWVLADAAGTTAGVRPTRAAGTAAFEVAVAAAAAAAVDEVAGIEARFNAPLPLPLLVLLLLFTTLRRLVVLPVFADPAFAARPPPTSSSSSSSSRAALPTVPATECDLPDADAPTRHAGNIDVPAPAPAPVLVLAVGASGSGSKPLSRRSTAGKAVSTICRTELMYT